MTDQAMTREEVLFAREKIVKQLTGTYKSMLNDIAITDAALREERDTLLTQLDSLRASDRAYAESQERSCALILELREELAQATARQHRSDLNYDALEKQLVQSHAKLEEWSTFEQTDIYQQFTDVRAKLAQVTQERDQAITELKWVRHERDTAREKLAELEGQP